MILRSRRYYVPSWQPQMPGTAVVLIGYITRAGTLHGQSPGWQADPPFRGEVACHCVVQRRYRPVEIIPAKPNAIPASA